MGIENLIRNKNWLLVLSLFLVTLAFGEVFFIVLFGSPDSLYWFECANLSVALAGVALAALNDSMQAIGLYMLVIAACILANTIGLGWRIVLIADLFVGTPSPCATANCFESVAVLATFCMFNVFSVLLLLFLLYFSFEIRSEFQWDVNKSKSDTVTTAQRELKKKNR